MRLRGLVYGPLLLGLLAMAGCSPDMKDGVGPRVPLPNVTGSVTRAGSSASGVRIDLRDPSDNAVVVKTRSDEQGGYGFEAPPGTWEVKANGRVPGDFDAVTRIFTVPSEHTMIRLPGLDISSYQAALTGPADGARMERPAVTTPISFRWHQPTHPFTSARVQLFDSTGAAFWYSSKTTDSSVSWDGLGNQGTFGGVGALPGWYLWRVKFELSDSSQARTDRWRLDLE